MILCSKICIFRASFSITVRDMGLTPSADQFCDSGFTYTIIIHVSSSCLHCMITSASRKKADPHIPGSGSRLKTRLRQEKHFKDMPCDQYEAAMKFWRIPEIMDKFLPYLDSRSVACLAQSRIGCTLHLLEHNSSAWNKLIRRTLPGDHKIERAMSSVEYWSIVRDMFKEKKIKVGHLIDILKMMEDSNFAMLDLL